MTRGGRRRGRSRRGRQPAGAPAERAGAPASPEQAAPAGDAAGKRRRRRGPSREQGLTSISQSMAGPKRLQTLPPDGLVLEEVISDMREEYGPPSTPQEYRLIIRTPPEEPERASGERRQAERPGDERAAARPAAAAPEGQPTTEEGPTRRGRARRRRRRSRAPRDPGGAGGEVAGGNGGA